jgi:TDG/mug DNA glycosylase family protein
VLSQLNAAYFRRRFALQSEVLSDVLQDNLLSVFCGTGAGNASAKLGFYYAHPDNLFWAILAETKLVDSIAPHEFRKVLEFGIGLTDICKKHVGNDNKLNVLPADVAALIAKILLHKPKYLAFTSKRAGQIFCGRDTKLGLQRTSPFADTQICVLPSTSLQARWQWNKTRHHWEDFASAVLKARGD